MEVIGVNVCLLVYRFIRYLAQGTMSNEPACYISSQSVPEKLWFLVTAYAASSVVHPWHAVVPRWLLGLEAVNGDLSSRMEGPR